jgi:hypothetical protein
MAEPNASSSPGSVPWRTVESFGALASVATAVLLVLSTAYDFNFLYALGLSFQELPSTLADHVRSAIVWVPHALLYIGGFAVFELLTRRIEGGMSEEELIARSSTPRITKAFRKSPKVLFAILVPLIVGVDFLLGNSNEALFMAAIVAWGVLAFSIANHPRLGSRFTSTTARLFIVVPLVVIWVSSLGYIRGNSMMRATTPTWNVEIKGSTSTELRKLVGLRRFSSVAILVEPGRRVSIVPAETVVRADAIRAHDADTPRACRWFGIACTQSGAKS